MQLLLSVLESCREDPLHVTDGCLLLLVACAFPAVSLFSCKEPSLEEDSVFSKGDMVVYPAHGVGVVKDIEIKEYAGANHSFYVLEILENGMRVMIPTGTSQSVGLRAIVNEDQVGEIFEILAEKDVEIGTQTWNRRYREYMEKIKTGSVHEVAAVLRDLFLLSTDKDLSYGERKMLDTAKGLLVKELSLAQEVEEDEVCKSIEAIFA